MWLKIKRAHTALSVKSLPTCVCAEVWSAKAFRAAPLGSCDCAKAERHVQRAAVLRKSLLLRFANRKLPPGVVLSRQEETGDLCREKEGGTGVRGKNRHVIHVGRETRQAFFLARGCL